MENLTIHPLPLFSGNARFGMPKMTYLANFGKDLTTCCYVWFIEGAEKKVLVDAGGTAETAVTLRGRPKKEVTQLQSLEEGLAKLKLRPRDIDLIILTHLHWDHVELAHQFANAKFVVQKDELDFACNPHHSAVEFYDKELFQGLDFEVITGDTQITKGIKVLLTPGHAAGGQSVAVETEEGIAVITGFCCIQGNFASSEGINKEGSVILPGIHLNTMQAYDSMLKVKKAADIIIPLHEPSYINVDTIP